MSILRDAADAASGSWVGLSGEADLLSVARSAVFASVARLSVVSSSMAWTRGPLASRTGRVGKSVGSYAANG
jgi:hypothetical protein